MDNIFLLHRKKGPALPNLDNVLIWSTCLRQIAFSQTDFDSQFENSICKDAGDEIYKGHEALSFLVEIVCGLHSPLIGETEVQGQFRQFLQTTSQEKEFLFKSFQASFQKVLTEAKIVREKYLCGTGSQSYGSLLRQLLGETSAENFSAAPSVALVGSGHLVSEILPWLSKSSQVSVYARSIEKAQNLKEVLASVEIIQLQKLSQCQSSVLVIAAPIGNTDLQALLAKAYDMIVDLRGQGEAPQVSWPASEYYDLQKFHQLLAQQAESRLSQKEKALQAIQNWKEAVSKEIQVRPFGWEDLCG